MSGSTQWSLAIQVEGAGAIGDVRAVHGRGARLRFQELDEPPREGDSIELRFLIPSIGEPLSLNARVKRVQEDERPRTGATLEVEFDDLTDTTLRFIDICNRLEGVALKQAEAIVAGLYDPTVMLDLQWRAVYYNSPYIKLAGIRPRALQRKLDGGTSAFAVIGNDPEADEQLAADAVRLGRAVHIAQTSFTNMAGDRYLGTMSFIPVLGPFGDVLALIQTFRDESAENRMQEHYKKLLAYERRRVERMAKLVTGLAHQINTPLGIMNTAGSVIESSLEVSVASISPTAVLDEDELESFFSQLRSSSLLLQRNLAKVNLLVTKVKDLSSTQLIATREHADLGDLIRESVAVLASAIKENDITINLDWSDDTRFPWDGYPDHLTRVLRELILNTISHAYGSGRGGILDIRISRVEGRDVYRLELQDYGEGMEQELLNQVFEPFVTSQPARATGLGLAIAENIVANLLHGQLECISELGVGSKFTIDLPAHVP